MKNKFIFSIFIYSAVVLSITATPYINWGSDDRVSKVLGGEYFAHKTYPIGSVVSVNVNGAEKQLVVNDRPKDERAEATVSASLARELGFYFMGKDNVTTTLISSPKDSEITSQSSKIKWYNIKGIYPRGGQGLVQLFSILIERGYKAEVDSSTKTLTVKYIPEYRVNNEIESLTLLSDSAFVPRAVETEIF